jgi:hypothetical protein
MLEHTVEFIHTQPQLAELADRTAKVRALALDIETINWWDREAEKVALVQLAFRENDHTHVAIIDTLANLELEPLRHPLELSLAMKAIHNASFDATRLLRHYRITTSPIHDTMLAARRSGEKKCSLKAQAETHLGLALDKTEQRSDWGRRPLSEEQLHYASLDAACTLLLYEQQLERGLRGDYELRERTNLRQPLLPLPESTLTEQPLTPILPTSALPSVELDLEAASLALLGIIAELSGRYSPEHLAVSVGNERVGLAGWIIDRTLGTEADIDEASAKQAIAALCEQQLARLSLTRRLEATQQGLQHWQTRKSQT